MAAYAAVAIAAVGTTIAIVSAIKHGEAAKEAGDANADVAAKNADQTRVSTAQDEAAFRIQMRKQLGDIRASYAASGVTMEGSPEDVMRESAANLETDALKIRREGNLRAEGYDDQSRLDRRAGENGLTSGYLSAAGALSSGAGRIYSSYGASGNAINGGQI